MIKIEFPADRKDIAEAIGIALLSIAGRTVIAPSNPEKLRSSPVFESEDHNLGAGEVGNDQTQTVETATDQASSTETSAGATASGSTDTRVDPKGVNFNAEFCGEAQVPFYASGKNKGQWKKKKGVTEEAYNEWYKNAIPMATNSTPQQDDAPLDTSGAFGGQNQAADEKPMPKDCGEFMGWVSAQQAAGHLNQHDITDAYAKLGLQVTDLFPPNDAAKIEEHVRNLYACLGGLE